MQVLWVPQTKACSSPSTDKTRFVLASLFSSSLRGTLARIYSSQNSFAIFCPIVFPERFPYFFFSAFSPPSVAIWGAHTQPLHLFF
jgi:hypothetical protein